MSEKMMAQCKIEAPNDKKWDLMQKLYDRGYRYFYIEYMGKGILKENLLRLISFLRQDVNINVMLDLGKLDYSDTLEVYMNISNYDGECKIYNQITVVAYTRNMINAIHNIPQIWKISYVYSSDDDIEDNRNLIEFCNKMHIHFVTVAIENYNLHDINKLKNSGLQVIVINVNSFNTGKLSEIESDIIGIEIDILYETTMYTVAYDDGGIFKEVQHIFGVGKELCTCNHEKKGYVFKGWKAERISDSKTCYSKGKEKRYYLEGKAPDGWKLFIYPEGYKAAKLSHIDNDCIIMKAQWQKSENSKSEYIGDTKEELLNALMSRNIVLLGTPERCAVFYSSYKEKLHIRAILSKSSGIYEDKGIRFEYAKYNKELIQTHDYIVICSPVKIWFDEEYEHWKKILRRDGFTHFQQYIRQGVARGILQGRKLWIWLGYCQVDQLRFIFNELGSVKKKYFFVGMRMGKDTIKDSYKYDDTIDLLRISDICCYTSWIFGKNLVEFDIESVVSSQTRMVSLPRIAFRGLYPYKDHDIDTHHKYTFDGELHWPFSYAENAIDELIIKGLSDDEIVNEIMKEDFYDESTIIKNYKLAIKSIKLSEANTSIKFSDYIEQNITKQSLYKDGLHYQNHMYFELARRISFVLGLDCTEEINSLEIKKNAEGVQYIDFTEIPVLPCVAKTLGLKYIDDSTKYRVKFTPNGKYRGTDYYIKQVTISEWIYMYCEYTRAHMSLKKIWNSDRKR